MFGTVFEGTATHIYGPGGGDELAAGARPRERADRVHVRLDDLGDAPGEEVPDDDPAVVASDGEERAEAVELRRQRHRHAVQRTVVLLRVVLTKGLKKFDIHLECPPSRLLLVEKFNLLFYLDNFAFCPFS